jgi:hypothetical protein
MAANSTIAISEIKARPETKNIESCEPKIMTLKQRIQHLLREVFEGREEFLGLTPD